MAAPNRHTRAAPAFELYRAAGPQNKFEIMQ